MIVVSAGVVIGFCCHWRIKDDAGSKWILDITSITHLSPASSQHFIQQALTWCKTFEFLPRPDLKSRIVTIRNITKLSQWFPASRRAMTGDRVNNPKGGNIRTASGLCSKYHALCTVSLAQTFVSEEGRRGTLNMWGIKTQILLYNAFFRPPTWNRISGRARLGHHLARWCSLDIPLRHLLGCPLVTALPTPLHQSLNTANILLITVTDWITHKI